MVPNYRLLATLFILNIATSLYARKQAQTTDDNEDKKTEASSSPPALSTGRDFTVNFDKLTKQNYFNKGMDENDITEDDDDRIWIISDDNIDEILNNTSIIGTDKTNNYELINPEGKTEKSPKLADTRKKGVKANKKTGKTKETSTNFTNTLTTVEPDENEIEESVGHKNPTKSEIHAYNSVKKQESQVSITFSNDGDNNKKSNDIISYKNKDNSSDNLVIQQLLNLLISKMAGATKNLEPKEMLAVLKEQQEVEESPVSTINDSKKTDSFSNNTNESNYNSKKPIETEREINEETNKTNDVNQTSTAIEKTLESPTGSKLLETTIIQNRNLNSFNNDPVLPRNLLTVINSGVIENMQAIVPLGGHNIIFNDKTINPGIHIVTANITSEDYMESVADMITTVSFEKKADLKILGKKAKKRLVQALIKSIEEGMILIINSGSINGLSLRLPGTDTTTPKETTTEKLTSEVTSEKLDIKTTSANPDNINSTDNLNVETTTKNSSTEITDELNLSIDVTSESTYADNITSTLSYSETTIKNPETEATTQDTNANVTTQTTNTNITNTEPDIERTTIDQNPKDELTKDIRIYSIGYTTKETINVKSSSPNFSNVTNNYSETEVSTENLNLGSNNMDADEKFKNVTLNNSVKNSDHVNISTRPNNKSTTEVTSEKIDQKISDNMLHAMREIQNEMVTVDPDTERIEMISTTKYQNRETTSKFDDRDKGVIVTTESEIYKENKDNYINNESIQSSEKLFKDNAFWHLNHILPHHHLDKRIYKNSHNANRKREIFNENSLKNTTFDNTRNADRENNDIKNIETVIKGADTLGSKVKRDIGFNFPLLGSLENVNYNKKIKGLMSYMKLLLDFAGNSEENNARQSFIREFYGEEDEEVPINTKF